MDNKETLLEQLRDEIRKAAGKGLEFDLSPYRERLEPGEIEKLQRFSNFEKLSHEAWEAGRNGSAFAPPSAGDEWSNEEIEILELMNLGGKAASRDLFHTFDLGNFKPIERIGGGAAGTVFKCENRYLPGRHRALKVLKPGAFSRERFLREAELLSKITSPYVVDIENVISGSDGNFCLLMEYVAGQSLRDIIQSNEKLLEKEVLKWMGQCCRGMEKVIAGRVIHRDLKPSNMLIDSEERNLRVCDFGLARELASENLLSDEPQEIPEDSFPDDPLPEEPDNDDSLEESASMTRTKEILGTPLYISPEQSENPGSADERSDIYSFGATFYHLLTGQPPFIAKTISETIGMHRGKPLIAPISINPGISNSLSQLLERCLAKNPNHRFVSFEVIREQLEAIEKGSAKPWAMEAGDSLSDFTHQYSNWRDAYLQFSFPHQAEHYHFPSNRRLIIECANIVDCEAEVIVSSDDPGLSMSGGVSRTIRNRAGVQIEQEAAIHPPIRTGRVVVTSAPGMQQRFIFHAITMMADLHKGTVSQIHPELTPSRDIILQLLDGCFYHAETYNIGSIAFPLLGTGSAGFDNATCLDTMVGYLINKLGKARATPVTKAHIVLLDPDKGDHYNSGKEQAPLE